MSTTRQLYLKGLETHTENITAHNDLMSLSRNLNSIEGVENLALLSQAGSELGSGLLAVGKWVGGGALKALASGFSSAGSALSKAFADNEVLVKKLLKQIEREDEYDYKISENVLKTLTSNGSIDNLKEDLNTLLDTLTAFSKHQVDVIDFLNKQLMVAKKLKGKKDTDSVLKVVDEFNELTYPVPNFKDKKDNTVRSEVLPGGKLLEFTSKGNDSVKYTMNSDDLSVSGSVDLTLDKSEVKELLSKLTKINNLYKSVKSSYDNYLSFVKSWSKMVQDVSKSLDDSKGVSKSVVGEAEKILVGNANALTFYSGFTPRVINYTDKYINVFIGVFA